MKQTQQRKGKKVVEVEVVETKAVGKSNKGKRLKSLKKNAAVGGSVQKEPKSVELLNELLNDVDDMKSGSDPLQGFKVIKWKLKGSETVHHLFIKRHAEGITEEIVKEKPPGRTLLCHNVPPYFADSHLRDVFGAFGSIEKIFIHQKPTAALPDKYDYMFPAEKNLIRGFKVAYIVYQEPKAVAEIMEIDPGDVEPVVVKSKLMCGLQSYIFQYNQSIVPTNALENSVRKFMESFDKEEVRRKEMEKNTGEPDDDGWVTVTRTGKRASGGAIRSEAMEERLRAKKRRQDKQLLNFTPAQMKESKMKQLMELKKKFEEDKQRVTLLKQQRKFKPF